MKLFHTKGVHFGVENSKRNFLAVVPTASLYKATCWNASGLMNL